MFANAEDVVHALSQLGDVERDEGRCLLTFEGGTQLLFEVDAERDALAVTADLGRPPAHARLAVCELLMTYTSLAASTSGIAMALTEPGGDFQQVCLVPLETLTADTLCTIARDLDKAAALWREVVAAGGEGAGTRVDETIASALTRA
jgi:hypothetical protein